MNESKPTEPVHAGEIVAEKYRVDRVLGVGGMGVVVAATHVHLDQRVALKFLLPSLAARADLVQRFLREARAAVKIQSEHVARVLDVGTHNGAPYMVMEYLEGEDLSNVIASRGPVAVAEAVGYVLEASEAVAEAHSLGIVHRDLKPANLFLARRSSGKPMVKVLDFGISKSAGTGADGVVTHASTIMGSPSYMSPEQLVASTSVDARTDIWALGVVLYELLARDLPFVANTMPELVAVILQQPPRPVITGLNVPSPLQLVLERCLQKDRERRFANVAELAQALAPFAPRHAESVQRVANVLGLGPPSSRSPAVSANAPRAIHEASATFSPTSSQVQSPRSPLLLVVPIVIALAAAGGALFIVKTRAHQAPATTTITTPTATTLAATSDAPILTLDPPIASAPVATSSPVAETPSPVHTHHARPSASSALSAAPASTCHTESFFDDKGQKHFKYVCP